MKFPIMTGLDVPQDIVQGWQETLNLMAEIANIPAALIMRAHARELEVYVRSEGPDNPYHPGERSALDTGLYCDMVLERREALVVPDALADPAWQNNPDLELGMVSYYGMPLEWPTGQVFGTICVLDCKANSYPDSIRRLVERFRSAIELDLRLLHSNAVLRESLETMSRSVGTLVEVEQREAVAGVAREVVHELNNLLMPIINLTSLARDQLPEDSRQRRNLDQVLRAADQARESIRRLHKTAVSRGVPIVPLDIAAVVRDALGAAAATLPAHVALHAEIPDHAGLVKARRDDLAAVVRDLLGKSAAAIGDAPARIRVALGPDAEVPDTLCLSIHDELPVAADDASAPAGGDGGAGPASAGQGLKLVALQSMLTAFGGRLEMPEAPGKYVNFQVILPQC